MNFSRRSWKQTSRLDEDLEIYELVWRCFLDFGISCPGSGQHRQIPTHARHLVFRFGTRLLGRNLVFDLPSANINLCLCVIYCFHSTLCLSPCACVHICRCWGLSLFSIFVTAATIRETRALQYFISFPVESFLFLVFFGLSDWCMNGFDSIISNSEYCTLCLVVVS